MKMIKELIEWVTFTTLLVVGVLILGLLVLPLALVEPLFEKKVRGHYYDKRWGG